MADAAAVEGTWKKQSINPAAKTKCADAIPTIKNSEYFDSFKDGIKTLMRTDPDKNAPVITSSHCNIDNGIVQSTLTGI